MGLEEEIPRALLIIIKELNYGRRKTCNEI